MTPEVGTRWMASTGLSFVVVETTKLSAHVVWDDGSPDWISLGYFKYGAYRRVDESNEENS